MILFEPPMKTTNQTYNWEQESPPAWTQEAYRPPRSHSKCLLFWVGGGGGGAIVPPLDLRLGTPHPPGPETRYPPHLDLDLGPPYLDLDLGHPLPGPGPGTPLPGPGPGTPPTWTWTWDPPPHQSVDRQFLPPAPEGWWKVFWKYNLPSSFGCGR